MIPHPFDDNIDNPGCGKALISYAGLILIAILIFAIGGPLAAAFFGGGY